MKAMKFRLKSRLGKLLAHDDRIRMWAPTFAGDTITTKLSPCESKGELGPGFNEAWWALLHKRGEGTRTTDGRASAARRSRDRTKRALELRRLISGNQLDDVSCSETSLMEQVRQKSSVCCGLHLRARHKP